MLTFLFLFCMLGVFGKLLGLAIRATWGIAKIVVSLIFLPLVLIGLLVAGLIYVAFPLLIIIGVAALIASAVKS